MDKRLVMLLLGLSLLGNLWQGLLLHTTREQVRVLNTTSTTSAVAYESGASYPLIRVVDGDTITVGSNARTEYVRLIGINAPEPNDPGGPECYAAQATAHLRELLTSGTVVLDFDPTQDQRDMYGRLLAYVTLPDGTDVGEEMLRDGFAHEYTYDKPYTRLETYKASEADAVAHERGLWSAGVCPIHS
jgi:micrococcal nuclease